jgi:hypothetical protein
MNPTERTHMQGEGRQKRKIIKLNFGMKMLNFISNLATVSLQIHLAKQFAFTENQQLGYETYPEIPTC